MQPLVAGSGDAPKGTFIYGIYNKLFFPDHYFLLLSTNLIVAMLEQANDLEHTSTLTQDDNYYKYSEDIYVAKTFQKESFNKTIPIHIPYGLLCTKIVLIDCPYGQYNLTSGGYTVTSNNINYEDKTQAFNFEKRTKALERITELINIPANIGNIDNFGSIWNTVNVIKYDISLRLAVPRNIVLPNELKIKFVGYDATTKESLKIEQIIYPNSTYDVNTCGPTCMFNVICDNVNENSEVIITIPDLALSFSSKEFIIGNHCNIAIFDPMQRAFGQQNKYLSDRMNKNSINLGRIENPVVIICKNCTIKELNSVKYTVYNCAGNIMAYPRFAH